VSGYFISKDFNNFTKSNYDIVFSNNPPNNFQGGHLAKRVNAVSNPKYPPLDGVLISHRNENFDGGVPYTFETQRYGEWFPNNVPSIPGRGRPDTPLLGAPYWINSTQRYVCYGTQGFSAGAGPQNDVVGAIFYSPLSANGSEFYIIDSGFPAFEISAWAQNNNLIVGVGGSQGNNGWGTSSGYGPYDNNGAIYSTDGGITWSLVPVPPIKFNSQKKFNTWRYLVYSHVLNLFVAFEGKSANLSTRNGGSNSINNIEWPDSDQVIYSADGANWTLLNLPVSKHWIGLMYIGGKVVGVARDGTIVYCTNNINTWTVFGQIPVPPSYITNIPSLGNVHYYPALNSNIITIYRV